MSDQSVPVPAPSPWILGPAQDLLLFVATPVLILPVVLLALQGFESKQIQYVILAFGSLGHNLPGMIRAYGDRALFRRFRARFILAPLVLGATCFASILTGSRAIVLIAFFWAAWHALMQIYGFLRIYDAKVGAFAPRIARLDLAMVIVWFGGAMVLSDARVYQVQELFVSFGVPPLAPGGLGVLRVVAALTIAGVTVAYVVNQVKRAGERVSPIKNLLMVTSIAFWWFAHFVTRDVLLGLIMFEIFHDVQYLAIVWIFNRRRASADEDAGGFTRFVFRNSWGMMGIYLGLVFAYGGIIPALQHFDLGETWTEILFAAVLTSALVHYYFDGFIWKVREQSTRRALGLDGESGKVDLRVPTHALKWLLYLVPFAVLWSISDPPTLRLERAEALARSTPDSAMALYELGHELRRSGRPAESLPVLTKSLAILPENAEARRGLALAHLGVGDDLLRVGDVAEAEHHFKAAYSAIPKIAMEASHQEAMRLRKEGKLDGAILHLRAMLLMQPDLAMAHFNLAVVYRDAKRFPLALEHAKRAAALGDEQAARLVRSLQGH